MSWAHVSRNDVEESLSSIEESMPEGVSLFYFLINPEWMQKAISECEDSFDVACVAYHYGKLLGLSGDRPGSMQRMLEHFDLWPICEECRGPLDWFKCNNDSCERYQGGR